MPDALRNRIIAARLYGGELSSNVADEVGDMIDDGRLSSDVGAAILRGLRPRPSQAGDVQVGDGAEGDSRLGNPPDGWGALWVGGARPANPDYAPPSLEPGYLYPPSLKQSRRGRGLFKRGSRSLAELRRIAELMESPTDGGRTWTKSTQSWSASGA